MTLLRRRPREVYRVYTEEEYLNGAGSEPAGAGEWPVVESADDWLAAVEPGSEWPVAGEPSAAAIDERIYGECTQPVTRVTRERRLRRVAGMALLAGAVATVGGVVAANNPWAQRGAGRRPEGLVAATRASRVVHAPVITGSYAAPSRSVVVPAAKTTRSRAARAGRWESDSHPPGGREPDTRLPTRPRGGVAAVVDHAPEVPAGGIAAPRPSADETTAPETTAPVSPADEAPAPAATASAVTARAGAESQAEFGFER